MSGELYGSSLIKGTNILDTISSHPAGLTTSEIAINTGITMSTCSKLLNTLEVLGYVHRDDNSKLYTLGGNLIRLASTSFMQFEVVRESYAALKKLNEQFDEIVHLGMLKNQQVMYINKFPSSKSKVATASRVGATTELYCSAMGKALLTNLSEKQRENYYESCSFEQKTPNTLTQVSELEEELAAVRQAGGVAIDREEIEEGIVCVGTTIDAEDEANRYAFSVSVPKEKLTPDYQAELIDAVKRTKNIIEFQLSMMKK